MNVGFTAKIVAWQLFFAFNGKEISIHDTIWIPYSGKMYCSAGTLCLIYYMLWREFALIPRYSLSHKFTPRNNHTSMILSKLWIFWKLFVFHMFVELHTSSPEQADGSLSMPHSLDQAMPPFFYLIVLRDAFFKDTSVYIVTDILLCSNSMYTVNVHTITEQFIPAFQN